MGVLYPFLATGLSPEKDESIMKMYMTERGKLIEILKGAEDKAIAYLQENDHKGYTPSLEELLGVYADYLLANGVTVPPCTVEDN